GVQLRRTGQARDHPRRICLDAPRSIRLVDEIATVGRYLQREDGCMSVLWRSTFLETPQHLFGARDGEPHGLPGAHRRRLRRNAVLRLTRGGPSSENGARHHRRPSEVEETTCGGSDLHEINDLVSSLAGSFSPRFEKKPNWSSGLPMGG